MAAKRSRWIHVVAALAGAAAMLYGLAMIRQAALLGGSAFAVLGFLLLGWSVLDARRSRRGTPESEIGGGHTIE